MTLSDMRWLWVYFKGSPGDPLEKQIPALFPEDSRTKFEGAGTDLTTGIRDVAYVFATAELAFEAARTLALSDLPLERVRISDYPSKSDPDYYRNDRVVASMEVKRPRRRVTSKPEPVAAATE